MTYKCIATVTWKFESDHGHGESLEKAKRLLETILDANPRGDDFDGFSVQVDLVRMKDRKRLVHLGAFAPEEVLPHATEEDVRREYRVGDKTYLVRMNSDRYRVFRDNPVCVSCGLRGTKMLLDANHGDASPHFNLYGEEAGRLVLMTKDHTVPKSKGGKDEHANLRTMCHCCNNLRGNHDLTLAQCRELRRLHANEAKLPRKELRELINKRREEMSQLNVAKEEHDRTTGDPRAAGGGSNSGGPAAAGV